MSARTACAVEIALTALLAALVVAGPTVAASANASIPARGGDRAASTAGLPPDPSAAAGAFCNGPGCGGPDPDPAGHAAGFGAAALGAAWIARRTPIRRAPTVGVPGRAGRS